MKYRVLSIAAAAFLAGVIVSPSFAACVAGTEDDFTYRGEVASACNADTANPGNPFTVFGDTWDELVKFDLDQDAPVNTIETGNELAFGGGTITFSLKFLGLGLDGFYGYELIADDDPDSVLPAQMDLVGVVKQSNGAQAYLFESVLVDDTGNLGTFKSLFGPNANNDFSHFSVYGGNYVAANGNGNGNGNGGGGGAVPEPATLALVGLGLLGAAAARRRRQR